jgi:hypothetical protein
LASRSVTFLPERARVIAAAIPAAPAPTISMEFYSILR